MMEYQWWHWAIYAVTWFANGWLWGHVRARKLEHKRLIEALNAVGQARFGPAQKMAEAPHE